MSKTLDARFCVEVLTEALERYDACRAPALSHGRDLRCLEGLHSSNASAHGPQLS